MLIDTLMDEMQAVGLENKVFDSKEKSKTFVHVGHFGPECFRCEKCFRIYILNDALQV